MSTGTIFTIFVAVAIVIGIVALWLRARAARRNRPPQRHSDAAGTPGHDRAAFIRNGGMSDPRGSI